MGVRLLFIYFDAFEQREVIPVDTHVHQIAIKYYELKGASLNGKKISMTPKIYDDINAKLCNVWGDYAGWAHSVCISVLTFLS
jgi:N-glycosylase/DNA lyase